MNGDDIGRLVYLGLLLAAVGSWVMVEYRQRMGQALRVAMAWGLIFVGLIAGYGLWQDIRGTVLPSQLVTTTGKIELPRAEDGHFYATLIINDTRARFMIDTGASGVVLTKDDARRFGLDPSALIYMGEASTANGIVRTARVKLDTLSFGPFEDRDFTAYVNDGDLDHSLLGMDYLNQFRIEIVGDRMLLSR